MRPLHRLVIVVLALIFISAPRARCAAAPSPAINVIFWFDTEDYLLPADDDAAKRLAEMFTERHIRATFKVVGEKARVLEKRGRTDVIEALGKHEIGYHANYHSVHPAPTEYMAECGLLDGMAEFIRREGRGAADVRRIFRVDSLACYGQPGSSWASQAIAALPEIGVTSHGFPCYVDSGSHVGMNGKPFWFAGALMVYNMRPNETRMELHKPDAVEPAKKAVSQIADRLRGEGGGLISIFYHPCEWVHQEFWDGVNFRRGMNPPREQWKAPLQRPTAETDAAFDRFAQYIDHIRTIPGVHFITARDLPIVYPDTVRSGDVTQSDLDELARGLTTPSMTGVNFQVVAGRAYSPADQFVLLASYLSAQIQIKPAAFPMSAPSLLGPDGSPPAIKEDTPREIPWYAFRDALADVQDYLNVEKRIPARVFIGANAIQPADFLVAMASVYQAQRAGGKLPTDSTVKLPRDTALLTANRVAKDTPGLFGGWIIHKDAFRAPKVLDVARLQAWTLKPALLAPQR